MSPTSPSGFAIRACVVAAVLVHGLMAQQSSSVGEADRGAVLAVTPAQKGYVPLTQAERFRQYVKHMFSAESFLRSAAGAGINQALNVPHEWGQGAEGYGRRFASSYGSHIIQSTVMYGASTFLHEDNRYFRSGLTGFRPRVKYAIASSFLARHDDGTRHFSWSRIGSYVSEAAISRAWQPPSERGPTHAVDSFAIVLGVETGFNIAREFLPRFFHSQPPVLPGQAH